MAGLPVCIQDTYGDRRDSLRVTLLDLLPVVSAEDVDVPRSARGRLVAEAVWCPMALVGPHVSWEAIDADRVRYILLVDGDMIPVTLCLSRDGTLRDVTSDRWGDVQAPGFDRLPYGFHVDAEMTFHGVTIPSRLTGGWWYGTERFDPAAAATFRITTARFAATD